jgi:hypothetical protein
MASRLIGQRYQIVPAKTLSLWLGRTGVVGGIRGGLAAPPGDARKSRLADIILTSSAERRLDPPAMPGSLGFADIILTSRGGARDPPI